MRCAKAAGRFGNHDFVYVAAEDVYRCPGHECPWWNLLAILLGEGAYLIGD
jgi:hypothetical protein